MPPCIQDGFLAFHNGDLVTHGFIHPTLSKELPPDFVNQTQLDNPAAGVSYKFLENGNIIETRRLLPASAISVEFQFRKLLRSGALSLAQVPGASALAFGLGVAGAGGLVQSLLTQTIIAGISAGFTDFTFHLLDADTELNLPLRVPSNLEEFRQFGSDGILELEDYPLSILAVTKSPLAFTEGDIENIGLARPPLTGINGITFEDGAFDVSQGASDIHEILTLNPGINIFVEIVRDERKLRYRADNEEATFSRHTPFHSRTKDDVTDKKIKVNPAGLDPGDTVYITGNFATKRRVRHSIHHEGTLGQDISRVGSTGSDVFAFNFEINAWNYQISKWKIPTEAGLATAGQACSVVGPDEKVNDIPFRFASEIDPLVPPEVEEIEGWRHSETLSLFTEFVWAADFRGIIRHNFITGVTDISLPASRILDQVWFNQFLEDNDLRNNTFEDAARDVDKTGVLFDISEQNNSLLFDNQKIPYHRPFALALKEVSKYTGAFDAGIGWPMLDLIHGNNILVTSAPAGVSGGGCSRRDIFELFNSPSPSPADVALRDSVLRSFDLSFAKFEETPMSSIFPSAYDGQTCGGSSPVEVLSDAADASNRGSYFDPQDPNNRFTVFIPVPSGQLESDWIIQTPFFIDNFSRKTRVYTEHFIGEVIDPFTLIYSSIFVTTFPLPDSSISAAASLFKDTSYVVFQDNDTTNVLSFHKFKEQVITDYIERTEVDIDAVHELPSFDDKKFRFVGYNRLLGDQPSHSNGIAITNETFAVCSERIDGSQFFGDVTLATNLSISSLPHAIDIDGIALLKEISLTISFNVDDVKDLKDEEILAAFEFGSSGLVVDSVPLPVKLSKSVIAAGGRRTASRSIDMRYYGGSPLTLHGDIWKNVTIDSMSMRIVNTADLVPFTFQAQQSSMVFDSHNRTHVFFTDDKSNNISVAISANGGSSWVVFRDILRLTKTDIATFPYAFSDPRSNVIRLFYVLNDEFLMYRPVYTKNLVCEDIFVEYNPPDIFDVNSNDDLGLEGFSEAGKLLRKQESFFVWGDSANPFMLQEHEISRLRNEAKKSFRFKIGTIQFDDDGVAQLALGTLNESFNGARYAVFKDRKGIIRVFMVKDGVFSIKSSSTFTSWSYDIRNIVFHRNFELQNEEINNIQVIYDETRDGIDVAYAVYFHDGMMFARRLLASSLDLRDPDGDLVAAQHKLAAYLDLNRDSNNKPIFLVGRLTNRIKEAIENNDSDLLVEFRYPSCFLEKFATDDFIVDEGTQPDGYFGRKNVRLFYRSGGGFTGSNRVFGLWLDLDLANTNEQCKRIEAVKESQNSINPKLDVQIKPKESQNG